MWYGTGPSTPGFAVCKTFYFCWLDNSTSLESGLLLALGMNANAGADQGRSRQAGSEPDSVVFNAGHVTAMRRTLHELANILTGVMISGGLLMEMLQEDKLRQHARGLCENGERGRQLVWELRGHLLTVAEAGEESGGSPSRSKGGKGQR